MERTQAEGTLIDQSFGLMRIGESLVALPALSIREVISGQPMYSGLPVTAEGLLGAIDVRGTIIPVLDLRPTLGFDISERPGHVVVILLWDGHLIGLTADDVCGIARVPDKDLFRLVTLGEASRPTIATHAFHCNGAIVTLLDAQRIAQLPNVPLVAEKAHVTRTNVSAAATQCIVLFSYGDLRFGIDATCVHATVPTVKIERSALSLGYCHGAIHHHGYDVPVVDTREAIGLATTHPTLKDATVIIIRFSEEAMLGFAIDLVSDIIRVAESEILSMPALQMDNASLFRGIVVDASGRQNLLLDADGLRAHPDLRLLAGFRKPRIPRDGTPRPGVRSHLAEGAERTVPFLTFVAGAEQASPLDQITEILNHPTDVASFAANESGLLGLFTHRGTVVPLVCLATLLGRSNTFYPIDARVLFVEDAGRAVGFVVEALLSIEVAARHSQTDKPGGDDLGRFRYLVTIGVGEDSRLVSHLDLIAEIAQFYCEPETTPVPAMAPIIEMERRAAAV